MKISKTLLLNLFLVPVTFYLLAFYIFELDIKFAHITTIFYLIIFFTFLNNKKPFTKFAFILIWGFAIFLILLHLFFSSTYVYYLITCFSMYLTINKWLAIFQAIKENKKDLWFLHHKSFFVSYLIAANNCSACLANEALASSSNTNSPVAQASGLTLVPVKSPTTCVLTNGNKAL